MSSLADLQRRLDVLRPRLRGYELRLRFDRTDLPVIEIWRDGFRVAIQSAESWLTEMESAHV